MISAGSTKCEKSGDYEATIVGSTAYADCDGGKIGQKSKKCIYENDSPQWGVESNTCRDPIAPSQFSYGVQDIKVASQVTKMLKPKLLGDANR